MRRSKMRYEDSIEKGMVAEGVTVGQCVRWWRYEIGECGVWGG